MTPQYRIFYSWQSDNKKARNALKKALETVVKGLKGGGVSIEIVEGGGGEGFISIEDAVRLKIRRCDIFVGDVTPVGSVALKGKLLPNANVMYEMGIATESMTADRVLAVAKKGDWRVEDMPFDFSHYSMLLYDENGEQRLQEAIRVRVKAVVDYARRVIGRFFSDRLLTKNMETHKYMPNAFLEAREAKELARCFVAPLKMYRFLFEQVERLDFTLLNRRKDKNGVQFDFALDVRRWNIEGRAVDLEMLHSKVDELVGYLHERVAELDKDGNWGWRSSLKVKHLAEKIEVMNRPLMVVTSGAGQGKTNFVCDLVNNVLRPDGIPYVFVNAYDLSAESLAASIAQEYNFIGDGSLESVVLQAEHYCKQQLQYFVVVIDGLNEHPNQKLFKTNLVRVLNALREYRHVKVLMTCRKEYYENNLGVLKDNFASDLQEVDLRYRRGSGELLESDWDCLLERYGSHFGTTGNPTPNVVYELSKSNSLLLLRIFFETNAGKDLSAIASINYVDLYENYYLLLCGKIQETIEAGMSEPVSAKMTDQIFDGILTWMIGRGVFRNMRMQEVMASLKADEQRCFHLFMNANLALQYDYPESGVGAEDVINFTFEELRDYLLVRYLVNSTYADNPGIFWNYVRNYTSEDNNLAEGVRRFLFLYCKNNDRNDIYEQLKDWPWFEATFARNILYVDDSKVSAEDVAEVKMQIKTKPALMVKPVVYMHWKPWEYKNVNINTFFDAMDGLQKADRERLLEEVWSDRLNEPYHPKMETKRKRFARDVQAAIERREKDGEKGVAELKKLLGYLIGEGRKVRASNEEDEAPYYAFRGYEMYRYLIAVHRGEREEFLKRAGTEKGFSALMMGDIYDAIFKESMDVEHVFEAYFCNEYKDLWEYVAMHYSLPVEWVKVFMDVVKNPDYRLIDFSSIDYGNDGLENFVFSDEMFVRFYNWLNWK